ncbi:hypothetical protein BKA70DRAFT_1425631 [Coprinopsis sp. MPI-PUGE-AT-0042]|nr:hypothetical protein BKA70DRAFT_1425631 [Coprinopsis sp. MPI-PUGE-AT-0042]
MPRESTRQTTRRPLQRRPLCRPRQSVVVVSSSSSESSSRTPSLSPPPSTQPRTSTADTSSIPELTFQYVFNFGCTARYMWVFRCPGFLGAFWERPCSDDELAAEETLVYTAREDAMQEIRSTMIRETAQIVVDETGYQLFFSSP